MAKEKVAIMIANGKTPRDQNIGFNRYKVMSVYHNIDIHNNTNCTINNYFFKMVLIFFSCFIYTQLY